MHPDRTVVLFNNCRGRDHVALFGAGAFYDLNITGSHATQARGLQVGQECVVATKGYHDEIVFRWFSFDHEETQPGDGEKEYRVFFGSFLLSETLDRSSAAHAPLYSGFFNVAGHFLQKSAIISTILLSDRPTQNLRALTQVPEEIDPSLGVLVEGATRTITVNAYERSGVARERCLQHYGASCAICDFSFGEVYGETAAGYIHVHHIKPLAELKTEYVIDPVEDLRPVCPNCHAVLHLGEKARSIDDVKRLLGKTIG